MQVNCPRLLIAGTQSGVGKTSITIGLVAALKRRGLKVQTFKVGPDFLDPTYLKIASGRTCYNLDAWMMGRDYVERLFAKSTHDADIAIIEGVMGLFDGFSPETSEGSTAQIAEWLKTPIALVVNASGVSRSFAAMVKGFVEFERKIKITGVIANHVGSANHTELLASSLVSVGMHGFMGGIKKGALPTLPGRHLGLVSANDKRLNTDTLNRLANTIEESISIDDVVTKSKAALPLQITSQQETGITKPKARLGVAMDEAFSFYYPDSLETFKQMGLELVPFSPLNDSGLPENLNAIYIGGGYPEIYAEKLSANHGMLRDVRQFAEFDLPVYAECGGLIYMSNGIETIDGKRYPLTGCLPAWAKMQKRFQALGYIETALTESAIWGEAGSNVRGHMFHYSKLDRDPCDNTAWKTKYSVRKKRTGEMFHEGYSKGKTLLSYTHLHFASNTIACKNFIKRCIEVKSI
ncbi:Cobyrinic acid a,c-diamide synthetase [hydrothermal vent metagenome]|uniref:Cobyrinic acid a,c-diamide synthetase n=1 Tax=hydrothermal vent metagenome TaxID=652676 RepID=A0A3B1BTN9_9ZZZZ